MTQHTLITIAMPGWCHVHTWHESHGEYVVDTYQKEYDPEDVFHRRELLHVYRYRNGSVSFACDKGTNANDYLMARHIRANPERFVKYAERTEPCATAGSEYFKDTLSGARWTIFGAAGHGEWAYATEY